MIYNMYLCHKNFFIYIIILKYINDMKTYRQLIYLVLDELKLISDDSTYTEEHIMTLLSNYRAFLLKQRYSDVRKEIPITNY